jgi:hypothetical protein
MIRLNTSKFTKYISFHARLNPFLSDFHVAESFQIKIAVANLLIQLAAYLRMVLRLRIYEFDRLIDHVDGVRLCF